MSEQSIDNTSSKKLITNDELKAEFGTWYSASGNKCPTSEQACNQLNHGNNAKYASASTSSGEENLKLFYRFVANIRTFNVKFLNGTEVLKSQWVNYGENASEPDTSGISGFKGWDKSFTNITRNINVRAIIENATYHTIRVHNYNCGEYSVDSIVSGQQFNFTDNTSVIPNGAEIVKWIHKPTSGLNEDITLPCTVTKDLELYPVYTTTNSVLLQIVGNQYDYDYETNHDADKEAAYIVVSDILCRGTANIVSPSVISDSDSCTGTIHLYLPESDNGQYTWDVPQVQTDKYAYFNGSVFVASNIDGDENEWIQFGAPNVINNRIDIDFKYQYTAGYEGHRLNLMDKPNDTYMIFNQCNIGGTAVDLFGIRLKYHKEVTPDCCSSSSCSIISLNFRAVVNGAETDGVLYPPGNAGWTVTNKRNLDEIPLEANTTFNIMGDQPVYIHLAPAKRKTGEGATDVPINLYLTTRDDCGKEMTWYMTNYNTQQLIEIHSSTDVSGGLVNAKPSASLANTFDCTDKIVAGDMTIRTLAPQVFVVTHEIDQQP